VIPYLGEFRYTVDSSGRVNVPAKFRDILKQEPSRDLVLIKGFDRCIFLLPLSTWTKFRAPMDADGFHTDRQARWFQRDLLRDGGVQQPDSQGRIQIPQGLREYAGIGESAVIYGNDDRIEVWAPETFDAYMEAGRHLGVSLEEGASTYLRRRGPSNDPSRGGADSG
jgi:MraZ protein